MICSRNFDRSEKTMTKILALAGSTRRKSWNKKLVAFAAERCRQHGMEVTLIDLSDYSLPLFDGDLEDEHGPPEAATRLYKMMKEHHGLLLSCPEYNSSITGVLKNTIDWISRPRAGEPPLAAFTGKVAGLLSASPGALGGMRGLVHVRSILSNIGVLVIPTQASLSNVQDAFDASGAIHDEKIARRIEGVVTQLVQTTEKLAAVDGH